MTHRIKLYKNNRNESIYIYEINGKNKEMYKRWAFFTIPELYKFIAGSKWYNSHEDRAERAGFEFVEYVCEIKDYHNFKVEYPEYFL